MATPAPEDSPKTKTSEPKKQEDSSRQTKQSLYLPAPSEGGNAAVANAPKLKNPTASLYLSAPGEPGPASVTKSPKSPIVQPVKSVQEDSSRQTKQSLYLPAPSEGGNAAIANSPKPVAKAVKTPEPKKLDDSSRQTKQSLYIPIASEGGNAAIANSPKLKNTTTAPGESGPVSLTKSPKAQVAQSVKQEDSSRQTKQSVYLPVPYQPGENKSNPMLTDSNYRLTTSASNTSTDTASVEGDKNPDDLVFAPTKKIVS